TAVGGNVELIDHERNGLLTPPDDFHALSRAILRLVNDEGLAIRLGANGRAKARKRFSNEAQARRFETFYRDILNA
ncbi:MAG: hypothetical protein N2C14_25570, partial [Planctomycetales bacterium]